jgi:hypothetical protein
MVHSRIAIFLGLLVALLATGTAFAVEQADASFLRPVADGHPAALVSGKLELGDNEVRFSAEGDPAIVVAYAAIQGVRFAPTPALLSGQPINWADSFQHKGTYFLTIETKDAPSGQAPVSLFRMEKRDMEMVRQLSTHLCHKPCEYKETTRSPFSPTILTVRAGE